MFINFCKYVNWVSWSQKLKKLGDKKISAYKQQIENLKGYKKSAEKGNFKKNRIYRDQNQLHFSTAVHSWTKP